MTYDHKAVIACSICILVASGCARDSLPERSNPEDAEEWTTAEDGITCAPDREIICTEAPCAVTYDVGPLREVMLKPMFEGVPEEMGEVQGVYIYLESEEFFLDYRLDRDAPTQQAAPVQLPVGTYEAEVSIALPIEGEPPSVSSLPWPVSLDPVVIEEGDGVQEIAIDLSEVQQLIDVTPRDLQWVFNGSPAPLEDVLSVHLHQKGRSIPLDGGTYRRYVPPGEYTLSTSYHDVDNEGIDIDVRRDVRLTADTKDDVLPTSLERVDVDATVRVHGTPLEVSIPEGTIRSSSHSTRLRFVSDEDDDVSIKQEYHFNANARGETRLSLVPGEYRVSLYHEGELIPLDRSVTVAEDRPLSLDFKTHEVTVKVEASGLPPDVELLGASARLTQHVSDGQVQDFSVAAELDERGAMQLSLPAGTYDMMWSYRLEHEVDEHDAQHFEGSEGRVMLIRGLEVDGDMSRTVSLPFSKLTFGFASEASLMSEGTRRYEITMGDGPLYYDKKSNGRLSGTSSHEKVVWTEGTRDISVYVPDATYPRVTVRPFNTPSEPEEGTQWDGDTWADLLVDGPTEVTMLKQTRATTISWLSEGEPIGRVLREDRRLYTGLFRDYWRLAQDRENLYPLSIRSFSHLHGYFQGGRRGEHSRQLFAPMPVGEYYVMSELFWGVENQSVSLRPKTRCLKMR